jgi:hypothetical protein
VKTYSWLQSRIANWLMREDLDSAIPDFIALAEASINRRLRVRQMITRAESVVNSRSLLKPNDWLGSVNVWVGDDNELSTTRFPSDVYPARIVTTGRPTSYTVLGNSFYFSQLPEIPTRIELAYFAEIPTLIPENGEEDLRAIALTQSAGLVFVTPEGKVVVRGTQEIPTLHTNWCLQQWPDLYLYGSLMHTAPYLKDDPRLAVWENLFEKALAEAKLSDSLSYDGTVHQILAE